MSEYNIGLCLCGVSNGYVGKVYVVVWSGNLVFVFVVVCFVVVCFFYGWMILDIVGSILFNVFGGWIIDMLWLMNVIYGVEYSYYKFG